MRCVLPLNTHTCSNAGGTNCTKVAVTLPSITASTSCSGSELVLLSRPEYDALIAKDAALTTAASNANSLAATANTNATTALTEIAKGLTLQVKPYEATTDDYSAITAIFVLALVAGSVIWGLKQIRRILLNPSES